MLLSNTALAFYFIIVAPYTSHHTDWREAPGAKGYASYAECKEGQLWYRMNDEWGAFSECYAREVSTSGK
jgi:hypothetical protein